MMYNLPKIFKATVKKTTQKHEIRDASWCNYSTLYTHIHISVILFLSFILFMLPVPPVIKVYSNPTGLQIGEHTQISTNC